MQFDTIEKKKIDQYEMRYQGSSPALRKYLFGGTYYSVYCFHRLQTVLVEVDNFGSICN